MLFREFVALWDSSWGVFESSLDIVARRSLIESLLDIVVGARSELVCVAYCLVLEPRGACPSGRILERPMPRVNDPNRIARI